MCSLTLLLLALARPAPASDDGGPARGPFDGLRFREIGPANPSGRIDDFAVLETDPTVFYVATATGGLWKTVNHGTTFEPVFDDQPTSSIGDVAIAPRDPNLVWVGTGENNNRQSSSWGDGVYKSTDGGKNWKNMGLADSRHIARILVDPVDHDVVYVAALGSLWGAGGDRGVFKTEDGGLTWKNVLSADADTGATELLMDPSNNKVLYAATYQRRRAAWGFNGGGPGSAIHKSTDAGRTWLKLTEGIPEGPKGRIGLDVYRKNPNVLYARIEHPDDGGVYRSDDAGASWKKMSSVNPRPMYFSQIRIDPQDDSRIYVLGVQLHVSDDGGKTFRDDGASRIHVDFHAMWIDPSDPRQVMLGGDGGVGVSYDRSETYVWLNNLPLAQFYRASFDMEVPYNVCGGLQDNNTWCGPSAVRSRSGIAPDDWFIIGGGDGFVALVDPKDPRVMYAESQNGRMNRVDRLTNERKSLQPQPPEGEKPYRWNWDTPMALSPHDPATLFVAANRVFRSGDRGHLFQSISPDLTTNVDREELQLMGVYGKDLKIAKNDGVSAYPTLVAFAESPLRAGLYWAGSDDGLVHVSRDAGANWANVTANVKGLPPGTYVSRLEPSRFEEERVYATFDGHRSNDFNTYVFLSDDGGRSFRSIASDIPKGQVARCIAEDLTNPEVLYLGTEAGLWATVDRGKHWSRIKANLPTVPIYEITLHPRDQDMILATHGRGIWILDDLRPIQHWAEASAAEAYLFEPAPAIQRNAAGNRMKEFEGDRQFLGTNPPGGAEFSYRLMSEAKDVKVIVRDDSGAVVRELAGDAMKDKNRAGINLAEWDLRLPPLKPVSSEGAGNPLFGPGLRGPFVLPGTYQVAISLEGKEVARGKVTVHGDPDIVISDSDRQAYFQAASEVHEMNGKANQAASAVVEAHEQMKAIQEKLKAKEPPEEITTRIEEQAKEIEGLRKRLGVAGGGFGPDPENVRGRIGQLRGALIGSTSIPTEAQSRQVGELRGALEKSLEDVNGTLERLRALYRDLAERNLYPSAPAAVSK
jgi:photosystem II stability/assembly factor-like uncharacterized protein